MHTPEFNKQFWNFSEILDDQDQEETVRMCEGAYRKYGKDECLKIQKINLPKGLIYTILNYKPTFTLSKQDVDYLKSMIKKHKNIDSYTLDFILAVDRAVWEDLIRHYFWSHGETKELINYLDERRKITDFMDEQDQLSEDELEEIWNDKIQPTSPRSKIISLPNGEPSSIQMKDLEKYGNPTMNEIIEYENLKVFDGNELVYKPIAKLWFKGTPAQKKKILKERQHAIDVLEGKKNYIKNFGETDELKEYLAKKRALLELEDELEDELVDESEQNNNSLLEEAWEESPKESIQEEVWSHTPDTSIVDNWVKEFDASILDFFISPMERMVIKQQLKNLVMTQKKMISDMILHSKAFIKLSDEEQRKQLAGFIRNLAKQGGRPAKF